MWAILELLLELVFNLVDAGSYWRLFLCAVGSLLAATVVDLRFPDRAVPVCVPLLVAGLALGAWWEFKSRSD